MIRARVVPWPLKETLASLLYPMNLAIRAH
jgi:hypothetical protein